MRRIVNARINRVPVFQKLSDAGRRLLNEGMMLKKIEANTRILHKGSQVSGAYVVIRGWLRVFSISPSGTEATLYSIEPGETCVLALNCLFQDLLYPAWVETNTTTEVGVIPGNIYRDLFHTESSIQNLTIKALSTSVFRLMTELEQLHFQKLEQRLVNLILSRASSKGVLRMTQQEIAYHLGTAREVISRILKTFVEKQYIRTLRGRIEILNAEKMLDMVTDQELV